MGKPTAEDYTELRMVAERYVDAVNRFDPDAWGETWAPDGEWTTSEVRKGRENMVEVWTNIMESIDMVFMKVYSGVIDDVSGDTASGRWYLGEFLHRGGGPPPRMNPRSGGPLRVHQLAGRRCAPRRGVAPRSPPRAPSRAAA